VRSASAPSWAAPRGDCHSTYGFGTTAAQVAAALLKMRLALNARPVTFTDIDQAINGGLVAGLAVAPSPLWPQSADALQELRDATGPTAPPAVKQVFRPHPPQPTPPPGTPEQQNLTVGQALTCNSQSGWSGFNAY
jgi:hypothetical protein